METTGATVRTWQDGDLEAIAQLREATAKVDFTDEGLVVVEPPTDPLFSGPTPQQDTLVVQDSQGRLLATAQLEVIIGPEQSFVWSFPVVDPPWRGSSVERLLLEGVWQLARDRCSEVPGGQACLFVHCGSHQKDRIALYETLGLRLMRQRPHMAYYPLPEPSRPQTPPGIELRPYARGLDDHSAVETLNQAFADDWEYVPVTADQWSRWPSGPTWRADLNLVAADGDEVVGLCLCIVDEERTQWLGRRDGYVETLCVRPSHQRKGIGAALLLAELRAFHRAGMVSATLETDEDNPTQAPRLYERVGFREIWRWLAYGSELR
ncbi:MAG: GNAT family N-acetyltransferase [Anaerolineae bacterium]|nr:GNAT family N-acetyltransferase [Anaerolineae bacterium]